MLEKIKEYKEIITIVVFFLGGFAWLESQFPKKVELQSDIGTLSCLLEQYMQLTQQQFLNQRLGEQIRDLKEKLSSNGGIVDMSGISPALMRVHGELAEQLDEAKGKYRDSVEQMEEINNRLARNYCG